MTFPYSHPSMPGTPRDFPAHVTATPKGTPPWHDTCTAKTDAEWNADFLAQATAYMTLPLESPESSSSSGCWSHLGQS